MSAWPPRSGGAIVWWRQGHLGLDPVVRKKGGAGWWRPAPLDQWEMASAPLDLSGIAFQPQVGRAELSLYSFPKSKPIVRRRAQLSASGAMAFDRDEGRQG